tara:strand:+ start:42 stop:557 length:516 start_codon:yes stop_codon:yes gene_type:complete
MGIFYSHGEAANPILSFQTKTVTGRNEYTGGMTYHSGYNLSITPSHSSNRILVIATMSLCHSPSTAYNGLGCQVRTNNGTSSFAEILGSHSSGNRGLLTMGTINNNDRNQGRHTWAGIHHPNTTNTVTYTCYFGATDGTGYMAVNGGWNDANNNETTRSSSTITLLEIRRV